MVVQPPNPQTLYWSCEPTDPLQLQQVSRLLENSKENFIHLPENRSQQSAETSYRACGSGGGLRGNLEGGSLGNVGPLSLSD